LRKTGLDVACRVEIHSSVSEGILARIRDTMPDLCAIQAHKHSALGRLLLNQTDHDLILQCPVPLLIVKIGRRRSGSTVLAALDPWQSNGKPASLDGDIIRVARSLSKSLRAPLHAAHVYGPPVQYIGEAAFAPVFAPLTPQEEKRYSAKVRQNFFAAAAKYRIARRNVHLKMGVPATKLPQIARSTKARMVVMGAVSRNAIKRALIGNTAEKVLDTMPCDILIVKP
jgi:universal stress protein E